MRQLLPFSDIAHLFKDFEHTAWRLESRRTYAADLVTDDFRAFLQTGAVPPVADSPWVLNVTRQQALGKRFERVRIVDEPMTDNQRFLLVSALGRPEDIRILGRRKAEELKLPQADFWLFDSKVLARLHFDGSDRTLGVELIEDSAEVLGACQLRDAAWHYAQPAQVFAAAVPSAM
ncbi:DUF6879 family protein [Streptacidiphilus cavernicola]|uniref:DUF6879 family protein n=1 Tax=Streptacidiphilus cavernicola TaxID=3342716 RepID=A0ABV6VXJ9_9ACTN